MDYSKQEKYDWRKHSDPERKSLLKDSITVPDMNYSVREIMQKFVTGQSISGMGSYNEFDGEYENSRYETPDFDNFMPNPNTLDLVDRQLMAQRAKNEIELIEQRKKHADKELNIKNEINEKRILELQEKINILENPAGGTNKKE